MESSNSFLFFQNMGSMTPVKSLILNGNTNNLETLEYISHLQNQSQDFLTLKASCNGLLLLESESSYPQPLRRRFYVCNPSIRKHSELAIPDYIASRQRNYLVSHLAFDPSKSPYYKIIFFWNDQLPFPDYHISIYSSETKTCRTLDYTLEAKCMDEPYTYLCPGKFFNGAIFWPDYLLGPSYYFDINQESIIHVQPNPPCSAPVNQIIPPFLIGGDGGPLHLVLDYPKDPLNVVDVYELKEDYSSWVAKYKVDLDAIAVAFPEIIYRENEDSEKSYRCWVVCVLEKQEDDEEDDGSVVITVGADQQFLFLAYNLKDKTTKMLCKTNEMIWSVPFHYTETPFGV